PTAVTSAGTCPTKAGTERITPLAEGRIPGNPGQLRERADLLRAAKAGHLRAAADPGAQDAHRQDHGSPADSLGEPRVTARSACTAGTRFPALPDRCQSIS